MKVTAGIIEPQEALRTNITGLQVYKKKKPLDMLLVHLPHFTLHSIPNNSCVYFIANEAGVLQPKAKNN